MLGLLSVFFLAIWVDIIGRGHGGVGLAIAGALVGAITVVCTFRAAMAAVIVDDSAVEVRNVFRTVTIPWNEITGFEVGRYRVLGCVLLIRCLDSRVVAAFAVQGITGQPRRRTSVRARATADALEQRRRDRSLRLAA